MNAINIKPFEILKSWQQHLNEENLSGVLKLYDISCVLIPTFSSEILTDHEQIKEFFVKMIEVQKWKVEFQLNSISEQQVGENMFLLRFYKKRRFPSRKSEYEKSAELIC